MRPAVAAVLALVVLAAGVGVYVALVLAAAVGGIVHVLTP